MSAADHRIRIAGTELEFGCSAGDTVLRAAQRAGIGFPYECNVGSCGSCRFELVDGDIASAWPEAPALSDKDRARRRHLGCQSQPLADCTVKLRTMAQYEPRHRPLRQRAVLRAVRPLTHDLHEFQFELALAHAFEPGQYALVWMPGVAGARAYSMSNTGDAGGLVWDFQVRQVPAGQGSAALFALRVGDAVEIDGPYGMAWLRRDAPRDILCLAGGSGLAPMISIARGAMAEPRLAGRRLDFLYGGRTPGDLCGADLLAALPGWGERLAYHAFVSTPPADGSWRGGTGFVHDAALRLFGSELARREIYFAGPPAMAEAVQRMLIDAGVPATQQHFDQFY